MRVQARANLEARVKVSPTRLCALRDSQGSSDRASDWNLIMSGCPWRPAMLCSIMMSRLLPAQPQTTKTTCFRNKPSGSETFNPTLSWIPILLPGNLYKTDITVGRDLLIYYEARTENLGSDSSLTCSMSVITIFPLSLLLTLSHAHAYRKRNVRLSDGFFSELNK